MTRPQGASLSREESALIDGASRLRILWSYMMAGATVSVLPGIILVILLQRYLVEGITLTGLGGR